MIAVFFYIGTPVHIRLFQLIMKMKINCLQNGINGYIFKVREIALHIDLHSLPIVTKVNVLLKKANKFLIRQYLYNLRYLSKNIKPINFL